MSISLDYYSREYPNFLDKSLCESLINKYENLVDSEFVEAKMGKGPVGVSACHGNCSQCSCNRMDLNNHPDFREDIGVIARKLINHLEVYKDDVKMDPWQWPEKYNFEFFKIKRYTPNRDAHNQHVDVRTLKSAPRFINFLIYLNDDFEGGHTKFQLTGKEVKPETGKLFMFPPMWPWLHSGEPPTGNRPKYLFLSHLHYAE